MVIHTSYTATKKKGKDHKTPQRARAFTKAHTSIQANPNPTITFTSVARPIGSKGNEAIDELAKEAANAPPAYSLNSFVGNSQPAYRQP